MTLLEDKPEIDLLFTDIVMPGGMNGMDVAEEMRKLYPRIKVIFTSGYTAGAIFHHDDLDESVEFLRKPYTKETLAQTVRRILNNQEN